MAALVGAAGFAAALVAFDSVSPLRRAYLPPIAWAPSGGSAFLFLLIAAFTACAWRLHSPPNRRFQVVLYAVVLYAAACTVLADINSFYFSRVLTKAGGDVLHATVVGLRHGAELVLLGDYLSLAVALGLTASGVRFRTAAAVQFTVLLGAYWFGGRAALHESWWAHAPAALAPNPGHLAAACCWALQSVLLILLGEVAERLSPRLDQNDPVRERQPLP